jgi:hypothetical protein
MARQQGHFRAKANAAGAFSLNGIAISQPTIHTGSA